ncbi:MAG: hypothetical protein BWY75_03723 [bacterium ADurb.Bin425]|nr:MAG: hypothetical protein BWY75_03723 [bacterium ADurb.Bin425]
MLRAVFEKDRHHLWIVGVAKFFKGVKGSIKSEHLDKCVFFLLVKCPVLIGGVVCERGLHATTSGEAFAFAYLLTVPVDYLVFAAFIAECVIDRERSLKTLRKWRKRCRSFHSDYC